MYCVAVLWSTFLTVGCVDTGSDNKPASPKSSTVDESPRLHTTTNNPTAPRNEPTVPRTSPGKIIGSGNKKTESRQVSGFSEIVINNVGTLTITQTTNESLTIEADDNILPLLTSEVSGNRLILGTKPNTSFSTNNPINYNLTVKDLSVIEASGAAGIIAKNINTPKLTAVFSGSGDVKISGTAQRQDLNIKGSASYKAFELASKEAYVIIKGSGSAFVNVSNVLDVKISGSGSVKYEGNPTISKKITGAGSIKRR